MCGSHGGKTRPDRSDWLYGTYQVYPVNWEAPELHPGWDILDIQMLGKIFPQGLEAYCVFALLIAGHEINHWAGATYDYLDRLAIGPLRAYHRRTSWKGIWRFVSFSEGRIREISRLDMAIHLTGSFTEFFWRSMRNLVDQGHVIITEQDNEHSAIPLQVYWPTTRLINKINLYLSRD